MSKKLTLGIIFLTIITLLLTALIVLIIYYNKDESDKVFSSNTKEFNLNEIALHNSKKDCWVIIGGVVYDATLVIYDNPAQEDQILTVCGGDGSSVFSVKKNTNVSKKTVNTLNNQLRKHQLGVLIP